jgi:hypothetical protein
MHWHLGSEERVRAYAVNSEQLSELAWRDTSDPPRVNQQTVHTSLETKLPIMVVSRARPTMKVLPLVKQLMKQR